tara:strand:- start:15789 stop:15992 length:204 start_codon:yes stop_codon:yes gene_type:complete
MKCPKCRSTNVEEKEEGGTTYFICKNCHYNELEDWDEAYPEDRNRQQGKTKHTPYKRGGGYRTRENK